MTTVESARVLDVSPVRRLVPWVATEWKRLSLAVFLGTMAIACGVGLLAVSAWLISSAALHPPIFELNVAIVGVRAFGIGRGCFRYAERLVSHDAAFRALRLRLAVYDRLAVVAPPPASGPTAAATCSSGSCATSTPRRTCRCACSSPYASGAMSR